MPVTVDLCMIVRDEALNLERCLASVRPWVTRCIVVDTGSCDETVTVARAAGCDVIHYPWQAHFADARNAGLAEVTGDWVLVLDADEILTVDDASLWHQAISADGLIGYRLKIFNVAEGGTLRSIVRSSPRLFRFCPGVRFQGRIHESVTDDLLGQSGVIRDLDGVAIKHLGYAQDVLASRDKLERNCQLSMMLVQEKPLDPVAWYHLANVACLQNRLPTTKDALAMLDTLFESGVVLPDNFLTRWFQLRAWASEKQGDSSRAVGILTEGLDLVGPNPELLYERGKLRGALGCDSEALVDFWHCVNATDSQFGGERVGVRGFLVYTEMMAIYARAGRMETASECAQLAACDPNCPADEASTLRRLAEQWKLTL
jgi:hypothetical protein